MDRYVQPVIFGLLNAAPLQLVKHEELGGRQFMHNPTTTSNVEDRDRHQLLRSLLHAGQGVPSRALQLIRPWDLNQGGVGIQGVFLSGVNPMTCELQQSSVN